MSINRPFGALLCFLFISSAFTLLLMDDPSVDQNDYVPPKEIEFIGINGNPIIALCHCELTTLQEKFCNRNFSKCVLLTCNYVFYRSAKELTSFLLIIHKGIVGRKIGPITHFYGNPKSNGVPMSGLIVPVRVEQVFEGPINVDTVIHIYYFMNTDDCRVNRSSIPQDYQPFLITGQSDFNVDVDN